MALFLLNSFRNPHAVPTLVLVLTNVKPDNPFLPAGYVSSFQMLLLCSYIHITVRFLWDIFVCLCVCVCMCVCVCVCVCARIALRTKTLIPRSVVKLQLPPALLIASVSLSFVAYIGALLSMSWLHSWSMAYRAADKSLAQPGRKQARKHVTDARDFNNIETWAVIKFLFSCKARRRRKLTQFWQKR